MRAPFPAATPGALDLFQKSWNWPLIQSGIVTGVIALVITLIAFYFTEETFHKDLNYLEGEEMLP